VCVCVKEREREKETEREREEEGKRAEQRERDGVFVCFIFGVCVRMFLNCIDVCFFRSSTWYK